MKHKERLDVVLVERGLCDSRSKAQALIMSGEVYVNGQKSDKAGTPVEDEAVVELRGNPCPYVSRGGLKLEKALRDFGVDPTGFVCSDSGASTGGFTDCLLQKGAKKVFAIMFVLTQPGEIALMRTPLPPFSLAAFFVRWMMAALLAP